jgi:hypothetical protein
MTSLSVRKKIVFLVAILFSLAAVLNFVAAPAAQALTLIPPSLEIALTPGQPTTTIIKLFNESQNKLELYTEVRSFTAKGETGQPDFDFTSEQTGLSTWIEVEKGPIVLESGQRREILVKFSPPVDADPGGHYATVFFSTTPPDQGQVRISSKLGTLLLAKVAGAVEEEGSVSEFGLTSGHQTFSRLPVDFYLKFSNTGNVHLRPTGTISITNMFGKETAEVEVNASRGATLPDSIRKYEATWEKAEVKAATGSWLSDFFREYANEKNNFALGRYTAKLSLNIGSSNVQDTASVAFWVIPWHIIIVWGVVAVLLIILLVVLMKKYNAWIVKKAGSEKK